MINAGDTWSRRGSWGAFVAVYSVSLSACLTNNVVRPGDGDSGADSHVAHDSAVNPSTDGGAPTGGAMCVPTTAPACSDSLPQARMLYEFQSAVAPRTAGGAPAAGCYLATALVPLGAAFGYGPTSMRVVQTGATTGVMQLQSERSGAPAYRIDLGFDSANAGALLEVRCPLDGFSQGRHRYAVRPDGSIELHWLEGDRVTGYLVFSRCAPTASGGCS